MTEESGRRVIGNHHPLLYDVKPPPRTPEALRRRKTAAEIRQEWNLPRSATNTSMTGPLGVASPRSSANLHNYPLPPIPDVNRVVPSFLYEDEIEGSDASPYSPPISQTSFYSQSPTPSTPSKMRERPVAQSPDLSLPKTAVGALLSAQNANNERPMATSPRLQVGRAQTAVGAVVAQSLQGSSHQPKNEWWTGHRNGEFSGYSGHSLVIPCAGSNHTLAVGRYDDVRSSTEVKDTAKFTNLNDSIDLPMYEKLEDDRSTYSPPISDDGSSILQGSPSSSLRRTGANETSFTMAFLQDDNKNTGPAPYDLEPIVYNRNQENQMPPQYQPGIMQWNGDFEQCLDEDDFGDDELGTKPSVVYEQSRRDWNRHRETRRKDVQHRERRIKEDLLLSTLERLQDNPDLMLETVGEQSPDELNMIVGIPSAFRDDIVKKLELLSQQVLQSFQFNSFRNGLSHEQDVVTALSFAHLAMKCAVPLSEKPTTFEV